MATLGGLQIRRLLAFLCLASFAHAAADGFLEYQVKAAFLLNFTKFIEWPPTAFEPADSPFAICVLGEDPFGAALDQIVAGEAVSGRKVTVQRMKAAPPPKSCQVLFTAKADKQIAKVLAELGPGVLTVGEGEEFIRQGGMVAFTLANHRVQFEIHPSVAETAGLKISSKLLTVARLVEK